MAGTARVSAGCVMHTKWQYTHPRGESNGRTHRTVGNPPTGARRGRGERVMRQRVSAQEVQADPSNVYQVTVHGDVPIQSVEVHGEGQNAWLYIQYANGSSSAGTPPHYHSFIRITEEGNES